MADGLKLDGLEVFADRTVNGLHFEISRGGLLSIPTYVGEDDEVVGATGREPGEWIADTLELAMHGTVVGASSDDPQVVRESFRSRAQALLAKLNPATLIDVVAYPPFFGLAVGQTATLSNVRPLGFEGQEPSPLWYEGWELTLRFVCIDSPPIWVVAP